MSKLQMIKLINEKMCEITNEQTNEWGKSTNEQMS
jgi:hypothetical protein